MRNLTLTIFAARAARWLVVLRMPPGSPGMPGPKPPHLFMGAIDMKRYATRIVVTLLLLQIWTVSVLAQDGSSTRGTGGGMMHGETMAQMMGGFMIVPMLIGLLVLILLVLAIAALVKYLRQG